MKMSTLICNPQTYAISGSNERRNIEVVREICSLVDELSPIPRDYLHESLIEFVSDRPGHDFRYALRADKIRSELEWAPLVSFESGLRRTVKWYIDNPKWWKPIRTGSYGGERLGLGRRRAKNGSS